MTRRVDLGRLIVGAVWLAWVLLVAATACADDVIHAGTVDLTLAGGYSFSHDVHAGTEHVDTYQLLPHVGYFLTDAHGPTGLRGNLELLAEPSLVHLTSKSESATAGGLSALVRWVFATDWIVRPYVEAGVGILAGQLDFRQTNCDVNFLIEGGPGVLVFVSDRAAVTAGYRFQHISNGGRCEKNLGLNSSLFLVGLTYFFP